MRLPVLRYHKPTRQHYVWDRATKSRVYLGTNPDTARQAYARWLASHGGPPALPHPSRMTVADAVEAYSRHADARYTDRRERARIRLALAIVVDLYGSQPAATFRAKALRDVRGRLLTGGAAPRARSYVNKLARAIQTAWRWLGSEELVPAESALSVAMVRALGPGDGGVELPPVLPPEVGAVDAALPRMPAMVAAMVRVQLLTGARPGEVCRMTAGEVSRDPSQPIPLPGTGRTVAAIRCGETTVWVYAPGSHKTLRRGKSRVILIGPQAQAVLGTFLVGKAAGDLVFPPRTSSRTPYKSSSYGKAVWRACVAAGCPPWSPNQLRHRRATELAEEFDAHTAAAVLGHAPGSGATAIYVEQAVRRAAEAAAMTG